MDPNLLYWKTEGQALPQIFIKRIGVRSAPIQTFFKSILPVPLSAALALFSVFTVRSEESETGIQVFDSSGNPVGLSKAAAEKAVRETALSRAALFGTTAAVPNLLVLLLKRSVTFKCSSVNVDKINSTCQTSSEIFLYRRRLFQRTLLVTPLRHISVVFVLGLMIPVSFSLFPQLGTVRSLILQCCNVFPVMNSADIDLVLQIKKENVEEELQAAAEGGQLYYHRGL
ncbi:Sideroflexin-4 [Nibea albiflora]|uniref:Sideroflexin-4 n=1 Tax=Nibea albiflora TaxID=240163 RepID=A0ACB7ED08_NIBAL|nr:Sideroflexin-4 [Nibea albiflora]